MINCKTQMYLIIKLVQMPNTEMNSDYAFEFSASDWTFVLTGCAHACMHTYTC